MGRTAKVIPLDNTLSREKWVKRIKDAWQEQLTSIFETGSLLEAAKAELVHGEWTAMFRDKNNELPFQQRTAEMLIAISNNDNLRNAKYVSCLPIQWSSLYELTKLTDEQFENGIKSGAINPKMQIKDVNVLRGIEPKKKDTAPLKPKSYEEWCSIFSGQITRGA